MIIHFATAGYPFVFSILGLGSNICHTKKMADEKSMGESLPSSGKKINYDDQSEDVNGRLKTVSDNEPSSSKSVSSKKKKKKKKAKKECCDHDHDAVDACSGHDHHDHGARPSANQMKDLQKFLDAMKIDGKPPKTAEEAKKKKYLFWDTQPVPKIGKLLCINIFGMF